MANRLPRFDPLTVLGSDDVNTLAAAIEANMGVEPGAGLNDTVMPDDAKVITKVFYADRPSNNVGYVDIEWPGAPLDGLLACIPQCYGADSVGRTMVVNSAGSTGASLQLRALSDGTTVNDQSSVRFFCLVIGWRSFT